MTTAHAALARRALWSFTLLCWTTAILFVVICAVAGAQLYTGYLLGGAIIVMQTTGTALIAQLIPDSEAVAARSYLAGRADADPDQVRRLR